MTSAINATRAAVALGMGLAGFLLGAYVGIGEVLIGGIIQVVEGIEADPNNAGDIAWGLVKAWLLWEPVWGGITAVGWMLGWAIWPKDRA